MKPFRTLLRLCPVLVATMILWAGEPWKEKPYTEWSEQEVEKILGRSPWAHSLGTADPTIPRGGGTSRTIDRGTSRTEVRQESNPVTGETVIREVTVREPGARGVGPPGERTKATQALQGLVVRWESSLTVREALVRSKQLRGTRGLGDTEKELSVTPSHYLIVVFGPSVSLLREAGEEEVGQSAYLEPKGTRHKLAPVRVAFGFYQGFSAVRFSFPRELEGKPLIQPSTTKVKFHWETKVTDIDTTFDLRKMVRDGKPDL